MCLKHYTQQTPTRTLEYGTACAVEGVALGLSKKLGTSSILCISRISQEEG